MAASAMASFPFISSFAMGSYLSTVMTTSGHILAQDAQPMHCAISKHSAGLYPLLLILSGDRRSIFFGQTLMHRPQPLQSCSLNVTFATLLPPIQLPARRQAGLDTVPVTVDASQDMHRYTLESILSTSIAVYCKETRHKLKER